MSEPRDKVGIDCRGDVCYLARVDDSAGRPTVRALARFQRHQLQQHRFLENAEVRISLTDRQAVVKSLRLAPTGKLPAEKLARFEMSQCLLGDEDEFLVDVAATGQPEHWLGMAVHAETASDAASLVAEPSDRKQEVMLGLRSWSLGAGFLTYCHAAGGDVVALADYWDDLTTLCLLHKRRVVSTGVIAHPVGQDCHSPDRMAMELRTVCNFKTEELADIGINSPLTALLMSGSRCDDVTVGALAKVFSIPVQPVKMAPGFFPSRVDLDQIPVSRYLAALGLTVA